MDGLDLHQDTRSRGASPMLYPPPHQLNRELYIVLAFLTVVTRHSTQASPVSPAPATRSAAWCCEVYVFQVARDRTGGGGSDGVAVRGSNTHSSL